MIKTVITRNRMIWGVLLMCVGLQIAGYGTSVCVSGELQKMNASEYYVLVGALGSLGIENPSVPLKMFRNRRLTAAFLCAVVTTAYATCSASYSIMWIRTNYSGFPRATIFNGTASLPQQVVMVILGMFLGAYIGKKFSERFRTFSILSNLALMAATGILFCLRFTGTAAAGDIKTIGNLPIGMVMIWIAVAIGGFAQVVTQSTYSVFWQMNTPKEDIPSGQALYNFGATGGSVVFGAVCGVVLGNSGDFSRAFAVGFVFACVGLVIALREFRIQ